MVLSRNQKKILQKIQLKLTFKWPAINRVQTCRLEKFQNDITTLEQNDNFLFDEQVIQDERLLNLEVRSDETVDELDQINDSVQSEFDQLLADLR